MKNCLSCHLSLLTLITFMLSTFSLRTMQRTIRLTSSSSRLMLHPSSSSLRTPLLRQSSPHSYRGSCLLSTQGGKEDEKKVTGSALNPIKQMWKSYGTVAIATYLSIYVATLGGVFVSLDQDIFSAATFGFDPIAAVTKVPTN